MSDGFRLRIDGFLPDPLAALAAEDALLAAVAEGREPPSLRLWSSGPCLVVPAALAQGPAFPAAARRSAAAGWPVLRRGSGGGAVPLDRGTLNLSLVLRRPASAAPEDDYRTLLALLRRMLSPLGLDLESGPVPGAFCDGRHNLTWAGRKLAGTAQRRRRSGDGIAVLAHALLLVDSDIAAGCDALNSFLSAFPDLPPVLPERHVTLAEAACRRDLMRGLVAGIGDGMPDASPGEATA